MPPQIIDNEPSEHKTQEEIDNLAKEKMGGFVQRLMKDEGIDSVLVMVKTKPGPYRPSEKTGVLIAASVNLDSISIFAKHLDFLVHKKIDENENRSFS